MRKNLTVAVLIVIVLMIFCSLVFTACSERHGIPNGEYCPIDENNQIIYRYPDYTWRVGNNRAITGRGFFTMTYKIVKENSKTYFEWTHNASKRIEVEYDTKTKVLTLYSLNEDGSRKETGRRYTKG
ncbi:MAG: hypothetical protein FWD49_06350 [Firmicutes bacterium]|nr:hypothetical protein [Bacillota bacterium]